MLPEAVRRRGREGPREVVRGRQQARHADARRGAITPNVACARGDLADSCTYGSHVPLATVALVGDSHAAHWRAGMDALAKSRRWRVVEFARPHCPFSFSEPAPTEAGASDCVAYNQRVIAWLAAHPDVATVFVSNNARLPMAEKGMGYKVQGARRRPARAPGVGDAHVRAARHADGARVDARLHPPRGAPQAHAGHAVRDPARSRARDGRDRRRSAAARPHRHRPHAVLLLVQAVLPGRRRRPRPQGPGPPDPELLAHARPVHRPGGRPRGANGLCAVGARADLDDLVEHPEVGLEREAALLAVLVRDGADEVLHGDRGVLVGGLEGGGRASSCGSRRR